VYFWMQEQMVRGKKVGCKKNFKRRDRSIGKGSDDSDDDYVVSDEENEVSDAWDDDYCSSLDRHASEESFGSFVEEEEEEEEVVVTKVVRSKVRSKGQKHTSAHRKIEVKTTRKRKRAAHDEEEEDEDEDYEVDEEEEDEDEEFILDEDDCSDEEEESVGRKKRNNTKVRKRGLRKKGSVRGQKRRKKSNFSKKPLRKKRRKNSGVRREVQYDDADDDNGEFLNDRLVVRENNKKKPSRRMRRYVARSDSDVVSSGSSDCDYNISEEEKHTISEEEREQVREAREICGSLRANLRSSCFPSRIEEVSDLQQHRNPPVRKGKEKLEEPLGKKGKEKVEEVRAEVVKQVCGICLSEEDKRRLRGTLDCCSHYFCFACINEWAKVESRCPLCKQRFKTISKPAKSAAGIDLREALIQVPERDQVSYCFPLTGFCFFILHFWLLISGFEMG
jgi:hypothetical protein